MSWHIHVPRIQRGANSSDRLERNEREASLKKEIRHVVNAYIRYNDHVSDYDKNYLGLTIPDVKPTPPSVPSTSPLARVEFGERLQHMIHFYDEESASKAKPKGVKGCEIWFKIGGDAPVDASELRYLATPSASPYSASFEGEFEGEKVYYWMRWINTRDEHGPWGVPTSAVIA